MANRPKTATITCNFFEYKELPYFTQLCLRKTIRHFAKPRKVLTYQQLFTRSWLQLAYSF